MDIQVPAPSIQRISIAMACVLTDLTATTDRRYAAQIAKDERLDPCTVSKILRRLEDLGFALSEWEQQSPQVLARRRRRYFQLTSRGRDWASSVLSRRRSR